MISAPEKDDDKNHDELVTVILDTAADVNGTSKEHIAYAGEFVLIAESMQCSGECM